MKLATSLSLPSPSLSGEPCARQQLRRDGDEVRPQDCGRHPRQGCSPGQPAARNKSRAVRLPFLTSLFLLIFLSLLTGPASAAIARGDRQRSALSFSGQLLVDRSEPPIPPRMDLERRGSEHHTSSSSSSTSTESSATTSSAAASSTAVSTTSSAAAAATTSADSGSTAALPVPFDTNLSSNFSTTTCPAFFKSFLSNTTFQNCHALSLLLQNSNSFFDASKSFTLITRALDASCKVNFSQCLSLMELYSSQIIDDDNCGVDYRNQNAMVVQAYNGFIAYQPLYSAGCSHDSKGNYCFADAITNKSSVADSYPYYLPLGNALPGSSSPTCNSCLQETMTIFDQFAGNSTQPLSKTYVTAAQQIDISCGPTFVNTTVKEISSGAAGPSAAYSPLLTLLTTLLIFLL